MAGKLGESLVVIGAVGVAGYIAYKYFIEGAGATPQGGLMVLPFKNQNYVTFSIDEQVVDIWSLTASDYIMLDVGVHTYRVDWGDGVNIFDDSFTIVEDSVLVLGGGAIMPWTQAYGCFPYSEKCETGLWYTCTAQGTWRATLTTC